MLDFICDIPHRKSLNAQSLFGHVISEMQNLIHRCEEPKTTRQSRAVQPGTGLLLYARNDEPNKTLRIDWYKTPYEKPEKDCELAQNSAGFSLRLSGGNFSAKTAKIFKM